MNHLLQQTVRFLHLSYKYKARDIILAREEISLNESNKKVICINLLSRKFPAKAYTLPSIPLSQDGWATVLFTVTPFYKRVFYKNGGVLLQL